jgi:protein-disulfide isomerase
LAPVLEQVLDHFPEKVKLVFKNYPISSHKFAVKAALTAQAAHLQGKFWQAHDALFQWHDQLNDEKIPEVVRSLGVDEEKLDKDRKSQPVTAYVQEDYNEANRIGVRGVPTIFINGKRLRERSFESIAAAVEKELRKKPAK